MGNSKLRLSHVMPHVWFYKLRDIGRFRETQRRRLAQPTHSTRDEAGISFSRSSHHFGRREKVYNHRASRKQEAKQKAQPQMGEIESMKAKTRKGGSSSSSTVRDSIISAGCSCRATVDSIWESRETTRDDNSSSDEDEKAVSFNNQSRKKCSTQFMERLDQAQLPPQLMSKSGNWKQSSHHFKYVAGLPSPVNEYEDFRQVQHLAQKMKVMSELGGNPFVLDNSLTRSNSCNSCRLSSVSFIDEKSVSLSSEEEVSVSFSDRKSPELYKGLAMEMEHNQIFLQYLEECRPSITRIKGFQNEIKEHNQKEGSEKKYVPARKTPHSGRRQLSAASVTNFPAEAPKKLGNLRSQIEHKNNTRVSSPKSGGINYKAKLRSKGTKSNAKLADKCQIVCSDMNSVKCGESAEEFGVCDSFAVVKSSCDPQKDFRESMVEMIKENNIHYHRDLQRLLRCYISLNPVENHDIIVKAFEQIRSDFTKMPS